MKDEKYYIVYSGEDGIDVDEVSKGELLKRLAPELGEKGTSRYGEVEILDKMPEIQDGQFGKNGYSLFIIKGKIVSPIAKKVVEEYEVE